MIPYQWYKNGDHPEDGSKITALGMLSEGNVVRHFRHPNISGTDQCKECEHIMFVHGFIDKGYYGQIVCPGDWIFKNRYGNWEASHEPPTFLFLLFETFWRFIGKAFRISAPRNKKTYSVPEEPKLEE